MCAKFSYYISHNPQFGKKVAEVIDVYFFLSITYILQSGCHIYVCGDASNMAHDVHNTLHDICMTEGKLNSEQAAQYLYNMADSNRYQKDVWVT